MEPEQILLAIIGVGLTLYALLGGADFGAGVWEFNTALQADERERALIYRAIGPVWEANHVWLIFVLMLLMSGFPPAFAALGRALWVPLLLALLGIVFRGVAFAFRSYAAGAVRQQAAWGAVFALASTAAPFFLGAAVGAIASGRLNVTPDGKYLGDYLTGWLGTLTIYTAFFVVGMCAYLAAVYLAREAHQEGDENLARLWRRRSLATGLWMGILAAAGLGIMTFDAPTLWAGFQQRAWPLFGSSVITGLGSLVAMWRNRYTWAALLAAGTVAAVVWGWVVAQYPAVIPPAITVESAKAPDNVIWIMLAAMAVGAVFLLPSLALLLVLFKGRRPTGTGEY